MSDPIADEIRRIAFGLRNISIETSKDRKKFLSFLDNIEMELGRAMGQSNDKMRHIERGTPSRFITVDDDLYTDFQFYSRAADVCRDLLKSLRATRGIISRV